jgi:hypothetical protein
VHFKPGESNIQQEFISEDNPFFVLHDSKGFEPADVTTFQTVRQFIVERSKKELELKRRIHALWCTYFSWSLPAIIHLLFRLCIETPTAGGRVFERGDENLLQLVHEHGIQSSLSTSPFTDFCDRLMIVNQFPL